MKTEEIYKKAIEKWGRELQIIMGIEEMAELTKALVKDLRGKRNYDNLMEELADVEIMLGQLKRLYVIGNDFKNIKARKLKRLTALLATKEKVE